MFTSEVKHEANRSLPLKTSPLFNQVQADVDGK